MIRKLGLFRVYPMGIQERGGLERPRRKSSQYFQCNREWVLLSSDKRISGLRL